jgi:hypothetical protein
MADTQFPRRGSTVNNPPGTRYSLWTWIKGYAALILLTPVWCLCWFLANVVRKLPDGITRKLLRWHTARTIARPNDIRIPGNMAIPAYMRRWWQWSRNAYCNCYLHIVLRSDDDTALHDHPWWNFSIVLEGGYYEHSILEGGVHTKVWYGPGMMQFRWHGGKAHRLELATAGNTDGTYTTNNNTISGFTEQPARTIFVTGPVLRRWGFHHPERWVDAYAWDEFCRERGIGGEKMAGYAEQVAKARTTE